MDDRYLFQQFLLVLERHTSLGLRDSCQLLLEVHITIPHTPSHYLQHSDSGHRALLVGSLGPRDSCLLKKLGSLAEYKSSDYLQHSDSQHRGLLVHDITLLQHSSPGSHDPCQLLDRLDSLCYSFTHTIRFYLQHSDSGCKVDNTPLDQCTLGCHLG